VPGLVDGSIGALDGVMFCFPDFIESLDFFARRITPLLKERGLR